MKRILFYLTSLSFCLILSQKLKADEVTISGRKILVNGNPYLIKGVCYQPVPKGSSNISYETLTQDLALMNEAGINTIRVYVPIDDEDVLDEIHAAGIKVIVGFGYNMNGYYDILSGSFIDYIKKYKGHDAILFWEFGNEYNYHPEWFGGDMNNWYTALNNAAEEAQNEDDNHPTATAHGELPNAQARNACPNIEVWGMNIYRYDNPAAAGNNLFAQWKAVSNKPMYISETGGDRYMTATMNGYEEGENEQAQADANETILKNTFANKDICAGVTLFEFCDEWWKAGKPDDHDIGGIAPFSSGVPFDRTANEEYWGIVDIDRNKMQTFDVVKEIYNNTTVGNIEKPLFNNIQVYPNPVTDRLNFKSEKPIKSISIYEMQGKMVETYRGVSIESTVDLSNLNEGSYIVCVQQLNGTKSFEKIYKN